MSSRVEGYAGGWEEDSATYVSSISTASMGLGGSMPRPEGGDARLINTRTRIKTQMQQQDLSELQKVIVMMSMD